MINFHVKVSADGAAWKDALIIDKATAFVGIGTDAPTARLTASDNADRPVTPPAGTTAHFVAEDGQNARFTLDTFGSGVTGHFCGRNARGTNAAPSAVQSGDVLFQLSGFGYGATGYSSGARAVARFGAAETWTDTAQGAYFTVFTTPTGSVSAGETFRVGADGSLSIRNNGQVLTDANGLLGLRSYTVTTLPSAATAARMIYVSNESGGAVIAFSDGTNWRRVTDRAVVS